MGCGSSTIEPVIDHEAEARRLKAIEREKRRLCLDTLRRREDDRKRLERDMLYSRVPSAQAMYYFLRQLTEESNRYPNLIAALAKPGLLFRRLSAIEQDARMYQVNFLPPALAARNQVQIPSANRLDDETGWGVNDYQFQDVDPRIAQTYARYFDRKLTIDSLPFPLWGIIDGPEPSRDVIVRLADEIQKQLRDQRADVNGSGAGAAFDYQHVLRLLAQLRVEQTALRSAAASSLQSAFGSKDLLSARARRALQIANNNNGTGSSSGSSSGADISTASRGTVSNAMDVLAELSTSTGVRKLKSARAYALWLDRHLNQLGLPQIFDAPSCLLPAPKSERSKLQQSVKAVPSLETSPQPRAPVVRPGENSRIGATHPVSNVDDAKDSEENDKLDPTIGIEDKVASQQTNNVNNNANPQANIQAIAKRIQGLLEAADWESLYLCLPSSLTSRMTVSSFSAAMSRIGEVISATFTVNSIDAQSPLSMDHILSKISSQSSEERPILHPSVANMSDSEVDNAVFALSPTCFPDQVLLRPQVHESSWEIVFVVESSILLERLTSRMVLHVSKADDTPQPPLQNGHKGSVSLDAGTSPITGFGFPILVKSSPLPPAATGHITGAVSGDQAQSQSSESEAKKRFALVPALNETVVGHRRFVYTAPAGRPYVVGCVLPPLEGSYTLGSFSVTCSNPTYQSVTMPDLNPHAPAGSGICALYCVGPCDVVVELEYVSAPSRLVWASSTHIAELGGYAEDPELTFAEPIQGHEGNGYAISPSTMATTIGESIDPSSPPRNLDPRASTLLAMPFLSTRNATNAHSNTMPAHKLWPQALQFADTYDHLRPLPGQDGASFKTWLGACTSSVLRKRQSEVSVTTLNAAPSTSTSGVVSSGTGHNRTFTFGTSGRVAGQTSKTDLITTIDGQACVLLAYDLYNYMVQTLYLSPSEDTLSNVSRVLSREAPTAASSSSLGTAGKIPSSASDLCDIYVAALRSLHIPTRFVRYTGATFVQFLAFGEGLGWITVDVPILQPLLFGSVHSCEPRLCVSKSPLIDASRLLTDSASSRALADETLSAAELFATLLHDPAAGDPREAVYELFAPEILRQTALVSNLISLLSKISKLGPFPSSRRYIRVSANSTRAAIYQETTRAGGGSVRWLLAWKGHRILDLKVALCGGLASAETIPMQFQLAKPEDMTLTSDGTQLVVASWASETLELNAWRDKLAEVGARYNWEALLATTPSPAGTISSPTPVMNTPRGGLSQPATPSSRAGDGGSVKIRLPPTALLPVVVESGGLFAWPASSQQQLVSAAALAPTEAPVAFATTSQTAVANTTSTTVPATSQVEGNPEATDSSLASLASTSNMPGQAESGEMVRTAEMELEYAPNWTTEDVATSPGIISKLPACALRYHIAI